MNNFDLETKQSLDMVNRNAEQKKQEAKARSRREAREELRKSKQQAKEKVIKVAITIILATSIAVGAVGLTHHFTAQNYEKNNVIISIEESKDIVSEKIKNYEKAMNMYANGNDAIEIGLDTRNFSTPKHEIMVDYKPENLAKHIVEASKKSESEARCVIIAAYRIINEPYRNQVIGRALSIANTQQNEETKYNIPNSSKEFLEQLGYEDWYEYQLEERANIIDQHAVEEYVNKTQGRTM